MGGKIVVAGALGLVGGAVIEHFERLGDWEIIGLSRRSPADPGRRTRFISVDLRDPADCQAKLGDIAGVAPPSHPQSSPFDGAARQRSATASARR